MRDHIFISYRRNDARGTSGRLYDWLRIGFGRDRVFRDVASINVGKWRDIIDEALGRSAACVVVIGPRWASPDNLLRLASDSDMVRHELLTSFRSDMVAMVPTLVEEAALPDKDALPPDIRQLLDWNFRIISETGWEDDTRRLMSEIATATGFKVGPDVDTLLRNASELQQRLTELGLKGDQHTHHIAALLRTIDDLTHRLAEASPSERPGLAAAFASLAIGDSRAAEVAFENEYHTQSRAVATANRTMAEAARNVGNLAMLRDVAKAAEYYRKALDVEPEHSETARLLGEALRVSGDLIGAQSAFTQSLQAAIAQGDSRSEMAAYWELGDVLLRIGTIKEVRAAYQKALELANQGLNTDPTNVECRLHVALGHEKIGDLQKVEGNRPEALISYRTGLAIRDALAATYPAVQKLQQALASSNHAIGDVLRDQGDRPGALTAYRKCQSVWEALTASNPGNTAWQRSLSVICDDIGFVLRQQGNFQAAIVEFRKGLAIDEALAALDPRNAESQRNLSVSLIKIGEILLIQGDPSRAMECYDKCLAIREQLATKDPSNLQWQGDLAILYDRIGNLLRGQGATNEALTAYQKGLVIRNALTVHDPANSERQRALSLSYHKMGTVLFVHGDHQGALAALGKSLDISEALVARDPTNADWQSDLARSRVDLGQMQHHVEEKLGNFRRAQEIFLRLKSARQLTESDMNVLQRLNEMITKLQ